LKKLYRPTPYRERLELSTIRRPRASQLPFRQVLKSGSFQVVLEVYGPEVASGEGW
jgi:hypothetical protein